MSQNSDCAGQKRAGRLKIYRFFSKKVESFDITGPKTSLMILNCYRYAKVTYPCAFKQFFKSLEVFGVIFFQNKAEIHKKPTEMSRKLKKPCIIPIFKY